MVSQRCETQLFRGFPGIRTMPGVAAGNSPAAWPVEMTVNGTAR